MSAPESNGRQGLVLNTLHVAIAAVLLFLSFLIHGVVPGFSADASAALGFLFFFYLGIPAVLVGIGTLVWSILAKGQWLSQLGLSLVAATILMVINVWAGAIASFSYLSFGVWALVQRIRQSRRTDS